MQEPIFGERRLFQPGDMIVREGAKLRDLYILARGVLEMSSTVDGETFIAGEVQSPEIIGESSFLEGMPHLAMITAKTQVELYIIRYEKIYDAAVGDTPEWCNCLIKILQNRLGSENSNIRVCSEKIREFKRKRKKCLNLTPDIAMANLKVLVVEDDLFNRDLAKKILEKHGHKATGVTNGLEALELLADFSFDLVLMDLQMPEMGGVEAARLIRQCEAANESFSEHRNLLNRLQARIEGGHIPIIAMTANNQEGEAEKCLEAGMDYFIAKPFRLQKALSALQLVLSRKVDRT